MRQHDASRFDPNEGAWLGNPETARTAWLEFRSDQAANQVSGSASRTTLPDVLVM